MMDKALLYAILKNKSGAEISASGNPATLSGTKEKPLKDLKVYGWSKQGSTTGKNLFDFSRLVSDGVNTMDYDKQTITVPAKTNNTGYNQTLRDLCPGITPGIYVFSMKQSNPESITGSYFLEAAMDFSINTPIELTDALMDNHISWYNNSDSEVENVISEIQIEAGDAATAYESYTGGQPSPNPEYPQEIVSAGSDGKIRIEVRGKNLLNFEEFLKTRGVIYTKESESYQIKETKNTYQNPQSLSISTPTGLPAIPVDKGGNYTDADGQQWVADYIDLKRGKYVQRISTIPVMSTDKWDKIKQSVYIVVADALTNTPCICSHFKNYKYINAYKDGMTNNINKAFVYTDTQYTASLEAWKAFLDKNDVSVSYILAEPVERDLTREEIQAYQNLVTYAGTTILENDADCYMEVSSGGGDALRAKKLALILGD